MEINSHVQHGSCCLKCGKSRFQNSDHFYKHFLHCSRRNKFVIITLEVPPVPSVFLQQVFESILLFRAVDWALERERSQTFLKQPKQRMRAQQVLDLAAVELRDRWGSPPGAWEEWVEVLVRPDSIKIRWLGLISNFKIVGLSANMIDSFTCGFVNYLNFTKMK